MEKAEEADDDKRGRKKKTALLLSAAHHERDGDKHLGHHGDAHEQVQHGVSQVSVDGVVDGRGEGDSAGRGEGDGDERHLFDGGRGRGFATSKVREAFFSIWKSKQARKSPEFCDSSRRRLESL